MLWAVAFVSEAFILRSNDLVNPITEYVKAILGK
jgi:hypothetical protein